MLLPQASLYPGMSGRTSWLPVAKITFLPFHVRPATSSTSKHASTSRTERAAVLAKVMVLYLALSSAAISLRRTAGCLLSCVGIVWAWELAAFLYSPESKMTTLLRSRPRAKAADSPAGPAPMIKTSKALRRRQGSTEFMEGMMVVSVLKAVFMNAWVLIGDES